MRSIFQALIFSVVILALNGCIRFDEDEVVEPLDPDLGKTYFFLEANKYREYDVFEIRYTAVDISDTLEYQLREEVKETFEGPNGQISRIIHRLTRENSTQEWALDSVWAARLEAERAISVENNIPVIKMVFPVDTSRTWDINLFNGRNSVRASYETFNTPSTVRLNTFLEAMEIEISNLTDGITFRDIRREVYADSIGLVLKDYDVVKLCSREECLGQLKVESGRRYIETLTAHGFIEEEED